MTPRHIGLPIALLLLLSLIAPGLPAVAQQPWEDWPDASCIECHLEVTPGIVEQYLSGAMGNEGVQNPDVASKLGGMERVPCMMCHGSDHTSSDDWAEAKLPDHNTCKSCHQQQVNEYLEGKHSLAWRAMMAIPMVQEMPNEEVLFGCGSCHKIGVKEPEELLELGLTRPYGMGATCDQCHTRHKFSTVEARQPEACSKCHMGFDHPQWEMWQTSKHGNIYFANKDAYPFEVSLKYIEPKDYPGPTCQLCHMTGGNHTVITPWGFVALVAFEGRPSGLEIVNDPEWESAKVEILKALRVLDPEGNPTPLLDAVVQLRLVRTSPDEFMAIRQKLVNVCSSCHSEDFAVQYLSAGDEIVRNSAVQLADAIVAIKEAREEGIYPPRPNEPDNPYPFLLNFYEEPSGVEREAWLIFLEYRMRAFQGMFHVNPDYTHWYGWSEIRRAVGDIKEDIEHAKEFKQAGAKLEGLDAGIGDLETKIKGLEDQVSGLSSTVSDLKSKVSELEGRIGELKGQAGVGIETTLAIALAVIAIIVALVAAVLSKKR